VKQLKQWRAAGDKIIIFMDHNKHVVTGALGMVLSDKNGLDLREAAIQHNGKHSGATFFCGSKPINGLW
jgi:hypothetical protein